MIIVSHASSGWPFVKLDILAMPQICKAILIWHTTPSKLFANLRRYSRANLLSKYVMLPGIEIRHFWNFFVANQVRLVLDFSMFVLNQLIEVLKKDGHILLTAKAFNGRVVLEWVSRCMPNLAHQRYDDHRLALLASCAPLVVN